MTFHQLRAFLTVAESLGLRAAAKRLNISQPAISKAMRELELELGAELFHRHSYGVTLTDYGLAFRRRASALLEEMRRATEEIEAIRAQSAGSVSLAASSAIARSILPPAFDAFDRRYPKVRVRMYEAMMPGALRQLRDGTVDLMAAHALPGIAGPDFGEIPLFRVTLNVCARKGHPLAQATDLADLIGARWIFPELVDETRQSIHRIFGSHNLQAPTHLTESQCYTGTLALVAKTDTLFLSAGADVDGLLATQGIVTVPIRQKLPDLIGMVFVRQGVPLTANAQAFIECLKEAAAQWLAASPERAALALA